MVTALKLRFYKRKESQLSQPFSIMQFEQKLMILEHFEVVEQNAVFCCFAIKTTKNG